MKTAQQIEKEFCSETIAGLTVEDLFLIYAKAYGDPLSSAEPGGRRYEIMAVAKEVRAHILANDPEVVKMREVLNKIRYVFLGNHMLKEIDAALQNKTEGDSATKERV